MHLYRYAIIVGTLVGLSLGGRSHAQSPTLPEPLAMVSEASLFQRSVPTKRDVSGEYALSAKFSVDIVDVPLKLALEELIVKSGVQILYSSIVPLERRVSIRGKDVTLEAALRQALAGTALEATIAPAGQVVIVKARHAGSAHPTQGVILGKVIHAKTHQPVAGATVTLDGASQGVTTGADGTFRLSAALGERTVFVRAVGFIRQSKKVTCADGVTTNVELVLEPSASVLDEVIVTGTVVATSRKEIPNPITVITAEEIEKRGITRIDQFFRGEVPGVVALDFGTASYSSSALSGYGGTTMEASAVYARGSASLDGAANPLKVYIDGIEMVDPNYLGTIDPKGIERIEIITGPQAATIYGSGAMGGVMQIFLKRGSGATHPEVRFNLRYGALENNFTSGFTPQHDHSVAVSGGSGTSFAYTVTGSYGYTGQWQTGLFARRIGGSFGATHTSGPVKVEGSFSGTAGRNGSSTGCGTGFTVGSNQFAVGNSEYFREWAKEGRVNSRYSNCIRTTESSSASTNVGLNVDYRFSDTWQHHLTLGRSATAFDKMPEAPFYSTPNDTLFGMSESQSSRTNASYNSTLLFPSNRFKATVVIGGNTALWSGSSISGAKVSPSSTDPWVASFRSDSPEDHSWGGFTSIQLGLFDRVYLNYGLRGEQNNKYGASYGVNWSPTYGITSTFDYHDVTLKLLASYGIATRQPPPGAREAQWSSSSSFDPDPYQSYVASPNLGPERSRGPQAGMEMFWGNVASLTLNWYEQTVYDLIASNPIDSVPLTYKTTGELFCWCSISQRINAATMRQHGWAATASMNIWKLSVKGSYSWDDSRITYHPNVNYSRIGQQFLLIPTHVGNVTATYAHGGTTMSLVSNFLGAKLNYDRHANLELRVVSQSTGMMRMPMYEPVVIRGGTLNLVHIPGYVKSDLLISHRVSPYVTLNMNVFNVSDNYDGDLGPLFPSLGRRTFLGASIRAL